MAFTEQNGHWYRRLPCGLVEAQHDANLTIARKQGLYTSVTSVLKIRAKPQLDAWIKKAIVRAVEATPRMAGEVDDSYFSRVEAVSDEQRNKAARFGTNLHDSIERKQAVTQEMQPWLDYALEFLDANFTEVWFHERKVADPRIGVAGTIDMAGMHKDGYPVLVDWKSQSCKGKKPTFYPEWVEQLAFYDSAYRHDNPMPERFRKMSAAIDSDVPAPVVPKLWSEEEATEGYRRFLCSAYTWMSIKPMGGYWPCGQKWNPADLWHYP